MRLRETAGENERVRGGVHQAGERSAPLSYVAAWTIKAATASPARPLCRSLTLSASPLLPLSDSRSVGYATC